VTIPVAALRVEGEQAVVFVYREGMAERRAVRLGEAAGDDRRVLAGIKAGERVILNPPQGLRDRETVKLEKEYGR
jgi:HlyD family secretion protein